MDRTTMPVAALVAFCVGCSSSPAPSSSAPQKPSHSALPPPSPTPTASEEPAPPVEPSASAIASSEPPLPPPPAVHAMIAGKSLSEISLDEIEAAFKKLGWKSEGVGGLESRGRESRTFTVTKGALSAEVTLVRPVPGKGVHSDSIIANAAAAAGMHKEDPSYVEGEVALIVTIPDKRAEAKKLLDSLLKVKKK